MADQFPKIKVRKVPPSRGCTQRHADKREKAVERLPATQEEARCFFCDAELTTAEIAGGGFMCDDCMETS